MLRSMLGWRHGAGTPAKRQDTTVALSCYIFAGVQHSLLAFGVVA